MPSMQALEYVDAVTDKMADLDLLAKVPLKFLRDNEVMPIMIDGNIVILTANPFDFQPLDELNMLAWWWSTVCSCAIGSYY